VCDEVIDLIRGQRLSERGHDLRESTLRPSASNHGLVSGVHLGCRLIAFAEIGKRTGRFKTGYRLWRPLPVASVAGSTSSLIQLLASLRIGFEGISEILRLCGCEKKNYTEGVEKRRCLRHPRSDDPIVGRCVRQCAWPEQKFLLIIVAILGCDPSTDFNQSVGVVPAGAHLHQRTADFVRGNFRIRAGQHRRGLELGGL